MRFLKGTLLNKFIDHTANLCNKTVSFGLPALSHLLVFQFPIIKIQVCAGQMHSQGQLQKLACFPFINDNHVHIVLAEQFLKSDTC